MKNTPYYQFISAFIIACSMTACASIIEGNSQTINLAGNVSASGTCKLSDKLGQYSARIPGAVTVSKGDGPLHINCEADGKTATKEVQEDLETWTLGNLLLGGVIGLGIDAYTGAYQTYPDEVTLHFMGDASPATPAPREIPAYAPSVR